MIDMKLTRWEEEDIIAAIANAANQTETNK